MKQIEDEMQQEDFEYKLYKVTSVMEEPNEEDD